MTRCYCSPCLAPGPGEGFVSSKMDDVERSQAEVIRRVSHSQGQSCCSETLQRDPRTCSRCVQVAALLKGENRHKRH